MDAEEKYVKKAIEEDSHSIDDVGIVDVDSDMSTVEEDGRQRRLLRLRLFNIVAYIIFCGHAFLMGNMLSLVPSTSSNTAVFCVVISIHKIFDGLVLATSLRPPRFHYIAYWLMFCVFCSMTPFGFLLGKVLLQMDLENNKTIEFLQSGAAGAFLAFAVSMLTEKRKHSGSRIVGLLICLAIGMFSIVLTEWFNED